MTEIVQMKGRAEPVEFDEAVLAGLCHTHGAQVEDVLARTLEEIEETLNLARVQLDGAYLSGLDRTCEDLIGLGEHIGMRSLERSAAAVRDCLRSGDNLALRACADRMLRLANPDCVDNWRVQSDALA